MGDRILKILIIEDDFSYAQLVEKILNRSSGTRFEVESCDCLSKGLERLARGDIDVILLDLLLPDSSGLDTFVRVHIEVPHIPIIIVTSIDDEILALNAVQSGAQDYLIKREVNNNHFVRSICYATQRHSLQRMKNSNDLSYDGFYLRNVIENNGDGIIIVDKDGVTNYINKAAEEMFGRSATELIGEFFGFPLVKGENTEIDILTRGGQQIVGEMRVVEILWEGKTAYLASIRDITDRKKKEKALYNQSFTDDLTQLYNRRGFLTLADRHLKDRRTRGELFLVFIDLDGLKQINDTFGHNEGNRAIVESSEVITKTFRDSDIIARWGGDEFVILLTDIPRDSIDFFKNRLQRNLEDQNAIEGRLYKLSFSVGIELYDPQNHRSVEDLLTSADKLMYSHKQSKKDYYSRGAASGITTTAYQKEN